MQIGISLQNNWGIEDVQSLIQLATRAEALGFASVWVHDHVFNAGHVFHRIGGNPYYEPLTLLLREQAQAAGRDVAEIPVSISLPLGASTASLLGASTRGYTLGTEPEEIVQKIQAFARLDVQRLLIDGYTSHMAEILPAMDMLAREVLPVFQ
jgi:hypothetical protein